MSHPADAASVSGRDAPRESGPPVAHEVKFYFVAECAPCEWRRQLETSRYNDEQLYRLATMHETGEAP